MSESLDSVQALEPWPQSAGGKGPLRCESCGYEIVIYRTPPPCPMCRELRWEPTRWRPFTRQNL